MIPLAKPTITKEEVKAVKNVLDSGVLSLGPNLEIFGKNFAEFIGTKYAVPVNSGTSALHLCIRSLGIGEGDEVITTPFSFIASSNCMLYEKAKPVFVDIDRESFNINPDFIEEKITEKTKAILVVHVFGQSADMDKIMSIANKYKLRVIEDAAESIGATYKGKKVGNFSDVSVFAFYPNKQMTTGEGGILTTNIKEIYEQCDSMANQGRGDSREWLIHERLGYNYRMDEMSAAVGIEQLKKLKKLLKEREELAKLYINELRGIKEIVLPNVKPYNTHSWFVFPAQVVDRVKRDKVISYLQKNGVASKAYFYPPIHLQPFYIKDFGYSIGDYPVTEDISNRTIILPFFVGMSIKQVREVKTKLLRALK